MMILNKQVRREGKRDSEVNCLMSEQFLKRNHIMLDLPFAMLTLFVRFMSYSIHQVRVQFWEFFIGSGLSRPNILPIVTALQVHFDYWFYNLHQGENVPNFGTRAKLVNHTELK